MHCIVYLFAASGSISTSASSSSSIAALRGVVEFCGVYCHTRARAVRANGRAEGRTCVRACVHSVLGGIHRGPLAYLLIRTPNGASAELYM